MNVKELEAKYLAQEAVITAMGGELANLKEAIDKGASERGALETAIADVRSMVENMGTAIGRLAEELQEVRDKVEGRNRSSASKRDMTEDDARRVLVGDLKDLNHKAAAEAAGLTYAQVYSCRGEFTFKHVHKLLREEQGFVNPFTRKK